MLDTRVLTALIGLGTGTIIEFLIAIIIYRKDPSFRANQLMSFGYLVLSCGLGVNLIYILVGGNSLFIVYAHRFTNFLAIITGIALYSAIVYVRKGPFGMHEYFYRISILVGIVFAVLTLTSPEIYILANPIPSVSQFIVWDYVYSFVAITPVVFYGILIFIQLSRLLISIPKEHITRRPIKISIFSFVLLIVSYFLFVIPHTLYYIFNNQNVLEALNLVGNIGALGFLVASILIAYSFISGRSKGTDLNISS